MSHGGEVLGGDTFYEMRIGTCGIQLMGFYSPLDLRDICHTSKEVLPRVLKVVVGVAPLTECLATPRVLARLRRAGLAPPSRCSPQPSFRGQLCVVELHFVALNFWVWLIFYYF